MALAVHSGGKAFRLVLLPRATGGSGASLHELRGQPRSRPHDLEPLSVRADAGGTRDNGNEADCISLPLR